MRRTARSRMHAPALVLTAAASALLAYGAPMAASGQPASARATRPAASAAATRPAALRVATPLGQAAVPLARRALGRLAGQYGLSRNDVAALSVSSVVPSGNGLTDVYFQQRVNGLDVFNAMLNVAIDSDGSLFRVASSAVPHAAAAAATPTLTDVQAAQSAVRALGLRATGSFASADAAHGSDQSRELGTGGVSSTPVTAHLVYQPDGDRLRLAWELGIDELGGQHWWQIRVDADSGAPLSRNDWVDADSHRVFPVPTEAPSFASPAGTRTLVSTPADATASPFGWNDTNGAAGAESTVTTGNNVNAYTDTDANNVPDPGSQPDGGASLAFDFPLDLSMAPSTYRPAAVSNLYFTNNRIHDIFYHYGFDEASGNFQVNDYGHGGAGGDPVLAEAQDGSGLNNANFGTPPDGSSPRMQMFLWNTASPGLDGDLDNGVIVHEYGHGISNRLTGGPANVGCLGNQEQAGEGWSDFFAYMLTMPNGTEPPGGRGIGTYVLNEPTTGPGIRTQKYSTDPAVNNETYDSIQLAVAPHGVGEVWAEMLWQVTWAMIAKYGFSPNLAGGTAGNNRTIQLVIDGLKLQPCSPGFVDGRDAILAADVADYAGADTCLLWSAFAKRGLGFSAQQGSSFSKFDGTQAFDLPATCAPAPPSVTATTPGSHAAAVAFAPGDDHGVAVSAFTSECVSTDGGATGTQAGGSSPITVTGLTQGKHYQCHVRATNAAGDGAFGGFGATVLVPTTPAAPTITSEKAKGTTAKVAFRAGANGGSTVTSYRVSCSGKGARTRTATGTASPVKVKHLTPGKKYRCRVQATNAVGTGPFSAKGKKFTVAPAHHHRRSAARRRLGGD